MGSITLVLGGARSGKSDYALKLAKEINRKTVFLATAVPFDEIMQDKITRHKKSRPHNWITIEQYNDFKKLKGNSKFCDSDVVLLDCLTLLVSNQMLDYDLNWEHIKPEEVDVIEKNIKLELKDLFDLSINKDLIVVSNEVGLGVVPASNISNYFRDIMGRTNQLVAKRAKTVIFMVAGIPITIKED